MDDFLTSFGTLLASTIRSCGLPCFRFPTPSTPSSGLRRIHRFLTEQHRRNVFASASMFRWLSTENTFFFLLTLVRKAS